MCFWGQSAEDGGLDDAGAAEDPLEAHTLNSNTTQVSSGFISTDFPLGYGLLGCFRRVCGRLCGEFDVIILLAERSS